MERVKEDPILVLRRANEALAEFFGRYCGQQVVGTEEEIEALQHIEQTLSAVAPLLERPFRRAQDQEIRQELARYRENLLRLHRELGSLQQSAMHARASVFVRQKHLNAAKAWCDAARSSN